MSCPLSHVYGICSAFLHHVIVPRRVSVLLALMSQSFMTYFIRRSRFIVQFRLALLSARNPSKRCEADVPDRILFVKGVCRTLNSHLHIANIVAFCCWKGVTYSAFSSGVTADSFENRPHRKYLEYWLMSWKLTLSANPTYEYVCIVHRQHTYV